MNKINTTKYLCLHYINGQLQIPIIVSLDMRESTWSNQVRSMSWFKNLEELRRSSSLTIPPRHTTVVPLVQTDGNTFVAPDEKLVSGYEAEFVDRSLWPTFTSTGEFYKHINYKASLRRYMPLKLTR